MTYLDFEMAFWHPFGPHSGESAEEILDRKAKEAASNGWTLWSFRALAKLPMGMFDKWHRELSQATSEIYAFCSNGGGVDPAGDGGVCCSHWQPHGDTKWRRIPKGVKVPHGFNDQKQYACAFKVSDVIRVELGEQLPVQVEYLNKDKGWIVPPAWNRAGRAEKLVRPCKTGITLPKKGICAVLKLAAPYLAYVKRPQ